MRPEQLSIRKENCLIRIEVLNEVPHGSLEDAQAACLRFLQGLPMLPVVMADAEAGQDSPGAIRAAAAVDKHRPIITVFQNPECTGDLLQRRRADPFHRDADKAHAVGLDHLLFVRNRMFVGPAQVHYGLDAALGQLLEAVIAGLAAAKDVIADNFEIRQTGVLTCNRSCGCY